MDTLMRMLSSYDIASPHQGPAVPGVVKREVRRRRPRPNPSHPSSPFGYDGRSKGTGQLPCRHKRRGRPTQPAAFVNSNTRARPGSESQRYHAGSRRYEALGRRDCPPRAKTSTVPSRPRTCTDPIATASMQFERAASKVDPLIRQSVSNSLSAQSWSRFLRQVAKVDSTTRRTIHHEDAQTVHGRVQGEGRA